MEATKKTFTSEGTQSSFTNFFYFRFINKCVPLTTKHTHSFFGLGSISCNLKNCLYFIDTDSYWMWTVFDTYFLCFAGILGNRGYGYHVLGWVSECLWYLYTVSKTWIRIDLRFSEQQWIVKDYITRRLLYCYVILNKISPTERLCLWLHFCIPSSGTWVTFGGQIPDEVGIKLTLGSY